VGLNALPMSLHPQARGFLDLGDMSFESYCVHMHIIYEFSITVKI
jgi:hypothetical protein